MAIVGVEGLQKSQLRACWVVTSPGSGASGPLLGEFLAYTPVFSRENAFAWLEKDLKIFGFFCLFCECAPMRPTSGARRLCTGPCRV